MATAKIRHLVSWHRHTFTVALVPDNNHTVPYYDFSVSGGLACIVAYQSRHIKHG
jgi:hypothetical protein